MYGRPNPDGTSSNCEDLGTNGLACSMNARSRLSARYWLGEPLSWASDAAAVGSTTLERTEEV
jgi:hypothetical protein